MSQFVSQADLVQEIQAATEQFTTEDQVQELVSSFVEAQTQDFVTSEQVAQQLSGYVTQQAVQELVDAAIQQALQEIVVDWDDIQNKPDIPVVPSNVGAFENDAGYVTASAIPSNVG